MQTSRQRPAGNMGFGVIGAGRCYLHHQSISSGSGRIAMEKTNKFLSLFKLPL